MRTTTMGLALACAALACRPVAATEALGGGALATVVRDAAGKPVAGALVVASGPVEREATTGPTGLVTLQLLPPGSYALRVTRSGYAPTTLDVRVADGPPALRVVAVALVAATFANDLGAPSVGIASERLDRSGDPNVAHVLENAPNVLVQAGTTPFSGGLALDGTLTNESRVLLDGIPLAGGPAGLNAVRFRNALALDAATVSPGPFAGSVRDAIGGVLNFQTAVPASAGSSTLSAGYDSQFGSFQQLQYARAAGRLGVSADALLGGGENRTQLLGASYAFSPVTALSLLAVGSQSAAAIDGVDVRSVAPVSALDLRSQLGAGTWLARVWRSSASTTGATGPLTASLESQRLAGTQISYALPIGPSSLSFAFDRESDATGAGALSSHATYTSATLGGALALSPRVALDLRDTLSGGTLVPRRTDPQASLDWRASERFALRVAVGSAFATAPGTTLAVTPANAPPLAPETSFGARLSVVNDLPGGDRAWLDVYRLRRYDLFASVSDADTHGVTLGFARGERAGHIGTDGYVSFAQSTAFGPVQPATRAFGTSPLAAGAQLPGVPYGKARLELTYGFTGGAQLRVGTTYYGANNPASATSLATTDGFLSLPVGGAFALRAGITNAFGRPVPPALQPYYAPRELTLSVGRSTGP